VTPLEELIQLTDRNGRRVFVANGPIDLGSATAGNCIYVLELPSDVIGVAGGRVGGFGERRLQRLLCFRQMNGEWGRVYETRDPSKMDRVELPYHASNMSIMLPDSTERVVSGVVDEELTQKYDELV
jgi:hypothetical protein